MKVIFVIPAARIQITGVPNAVVAWRAMARRCRDTVPNLRERGVRIEEVRRED